MEPIAAEQVTHDEPGPKADEARPPSRLECLGGVIVSPLKTFAHLSERPQWFLPLVVILLYLLVNKIVPLIAMLYTMIPEMVEAVEGATTEAFGPAYFVFISTLSLGASVLFALVVLFAMAAALYGIARIFKGAPKFFALVSTLAYAEFVPRLVSVSIKEFMPLLTGSSRPFASELPTGVAPIFSNFDLPMVAEIFLMRIELFHLWSLALVAIAVRFAAKVSGERAMLITLLYWIVCILAVAGSNTAQEMLRSYMMG